MKKFVLAVLAAIAFTGVQAQAFPDIPADHWAGEAVQRIADLGIVIGFPDGTFRGNEGFTRYQAALVVSRLLDVIRADMDAMKALTDADIASLRNALQELASDVAAQDVRLSAVEGAVASISDDVASNTARIEALENTPGGIPDDVLQDLLNQINAARVAADTAQATADAAAAAAQAAQDQSAQNAAAIDAINDLLALLNEDLENLGVPSDTSGLQAQVDRNTSDIANIREFVILLRRDQVALRDRVAALEASDAAQQAAIDDLTARVTAIEEDLFSISGSIELTYRAYRLSGAGIPFDVDRVWGLNNRARYGDGTSRFSSGTEDLDDDGGTDEVAERAQDRQDIEPADAGDDGFEAVVTLNVGWGTERAGTGDPRALNSFDSVITLTTRRAANLCEENDPGECQTDDDADSEAFAGYVFVVDSFTATFDPIGAAPLTFQYGEEPTAAFTPYIFDAGGPGFVATVSSPDFLAFLNPTLTIAGGAGGDDTYFADTNVPDDYYRGIRGTLNPLQGETLSATGGFSFAQYSYNAGDNADAAGDNEGVTVWGLDAQIGISVFDITAEYASQSVTDGYVATVDDAPVEDASLLYVQAVADVASLGIPVLKSLEANYRMIPLGWDGVLTNGDDQIFDYNQSGFGVRGELGLFIVDVAAYFDNYTTEDNVGTTDDDESGSTTAFGVNAKADLFAGFVVNGFFHSASVDGAVVDDVDGAGTKREDKNLEPHDIEGYRFANKNYDTGFGVRLDHVGSSENALIPNLNLYAGFSRVGAGFNETVIEAGADYVLRVAIVELTPYVEFRSANDADAGSDDTNEIKVGTGLRTDELGIIFRPSLVAAVNYRTNSHTDVGGTTPDYTASELQWSAGLNLGEFLFPNSTLEVRYGSWTGTNIRGIALDDGSPIDPDDDATDISDGDAFNNGVQSVSGYEIHWDYYDLRFTYGAYNNSVTGSTDPTLVNNSTGSQAFRIAYKVNF
jgi:hypothetical protein